MAFVVRENGMKTFPVVVNKENVDTQTNSSHKTYYDRAGQGNSNNKIRVYQTYR